MYLCGVNKLKQKFNADKQNGADMMIVIPKTNLVTKVKLC